jgi:hypothetical protein
MNETYEGTRGSTQGERNDSTPANKARENEMSFIKVYSNPHYS